MLAGTAVTIASGPAGDPAEMVPFAHNIVVVRPDLCEKRKPVCIGIGRSFVDADDYLHDHTADALALMQKRFSTLDPKLLAAAFDDVVRATPRPPAPTRAALENADLYNIEAGLMKPEEKLASYDAIFTDDYVK